MKLFFACNKHVEFKWATVSKHRGTCSPRRTLSLSWQLASLSIMFFIGQIAHNTKLGTWGPLKGQRGLWLVHTPPTTPHLGHGPMFGSKTVVVVVVVADGRALPSTTMSSSAPQSWEAMVTTHMWDCSQTILRLLDAIVKLFFACNKWGVQKSMNQNPRQGPPRWASHQRLSGIRHVTQSESPNSW